MCDHHQFVDMRDIGRRKTSNIRKEITVRNIIFLNKYLVYRKECFDARSFAVCTYLTPHNLEINIFNLLLFLRLAEYWWRVFVAVQSFAATTTTMTTTTNDYDEWLRLRRSASIGIPTNSNRFQSWTIFNLILNKFIDENIEIKMK